MTETHLLRKTLHSLAANMRSVLYRLSRIHIFIERACNYILTLYLKIVSFQDQSVNVHRIVHEMSSSVLQDTPISCTAVQIVSGAVFIT